MNATVAAIGKMNFSGNVIPSRWFETLRFDNGKPHTVAIICLSEVIYWYRPVEEKDETTGKITGYRQKFRAAKWQCHYQAMADRFGFTKEQVRNALHFLRDKGYVTLEFKSVTVKGAPPLSNVLFIEPVPEKIAELTYGLPNDQPAHVGTETDMGAAMWAQKPTPMGTEVDTYTETPTKTPKDSPPRDFLGDVLAHAQKPKPQAGIGDPSQDVELYWQYKNEAVKIYVDKSGKAPPPANKEAIEALVKDGFDSALWGDVIAAYIGNGWNPSNVNGMIEYYERGEVPPPTVKGRNGNGQGKHPATGRQPDNRLDAVSQKLSDALAARARPDNPGANAELSVLPSANTT